MNIYIVDDSEIMHERLATLFSSIEGIKISGEAKTETEAVKGIMELKPDIVILDVCLQKGNGINVLRELKQQDSKASFIILTSYMYPQYVSKCLELGADFVFSKNSDIEKLIYTLRNFKKNKLPANGEFI
jgi:NarL family two-component system response regulator LiaR